MLGAVLTLLLSFSVRPFALCMKFIRSIKVFLEIMIFARFRMAKKCFGYWIIWDTFFKSFSHVLLSPLVALGIAVHSVWRSGCDC